IGVGPFLFAMSYASELSARGLLYFGTTDGLLQGSIPSLTTWVLGVDGAVIAVFIFLGILALAFCSIALDRRMVIAVLLFVLGAELCGRVVLGVGFDVLYPQDRTAMHWVPIMILLLSFSLDRLASLNKRWQWISALLIWLPVRTLASANMDHTMYWPEQAIPDEVFTIAETRQAMSERPLLVGGYRQNPACWSYGCTLRGGQLNFMDTEGFPQPTCDLLLIDTTHFVAPSGFRTVFAASHGKMNLMERVHPLQTRSLADTTRSIPQNADEYMGLWPTSDSVVLSREQLLEIDAALRSDLEALQLRVVVEVKDSTGGTLHYDVQDIDRLRAHWQGDRLHVLRRIPAFPGKQVRLAIYFWNPFKQSYSADAVHVTLLEVGP
ncbi:MAG TPA: hypothetical protein PK760_10970, partial [Flavobacteriales bacterium]|nr:hypothetical protein [Flavobacteriales bacterium]